jgi:hypothetical protein
LIEEVCEFVEHETNSKKIHPDTELYRGIGCTGDDVVDLLVAMEAAFSCSFPPGTFDGYCEFTGSDWEDLYRRIRKRPLRPGLTPRILARLIEESRVAPPV